MTSPLVRHRERCGLTRADCAMLLGLSPQIVGYWERGDLAPTPERLDELSTLFGVPASLLRRELTAFRHHRCQRVRARLAGRGER